MNRTRPNSFNHEKASARIVWRDGPFRMECMDAGHGMRLTVFRNDSVVAEERVASAEVAWRRSAEICQQLSRRAVGERGSA